MKYSIDGGSTYHDAPEGVRVLYEGVDVPGEDAPGEVHYNHTGEGLITDVWVTRDTSLDHNIGTDCEQISDLVDRLVEEGS